MKKDLIQSFYGMNTFIKENSALILSGIAATGVVLTGILVAKETPKALKLIENAEKKKDNLLTIPEKVIIAAPAYIPAVISATGTVACIFGATALNQKKQASLTAAYILLNNYHKEYQKQLIDICGEETDKK